MNYDTWKTTEPEPYPGGHVGHRQSFRHACEGLRRSIEKASVWGPSFADDLFNEAEAVWFAKHVASEARRLKLVR